MQGLPELFLERMKKLLGSEYDAFLTAYAAPKGAALRVNRLKLTGAGLKELVPFALQPVPWNEDGFYYDAAERPGKHPYHAAGLYYIQEPSAMAVAKQLSVKPGMKVLDLAAAPGGKATQLACDLQGEGLLVANEIHPARAKILAENLERFGVRNTVIFNETPDRLAQVFPNYFDAILLDAPCSGEGMFRKDPAACEEWRPESPAFCAGRQKEILAAAAKMLKSGGRLMYSTCTFAPEENEQVIAWLLDQKLGFELIPLQPKHSMSSARTEWSESQRDVSGAMRLWPHLLKGEGHFMALLEKRAELADLNEPKVKSKTKKGRQKEKPALSSDMIRFYQDFTKQVLVNPPQENLGLFGPHLYQMPLELNRLVGLKVVRPGWHLGTFGRSHFEPAHALALALRDTEIQQKLSCSVDSPEIKLFLQGQGWSGDCGPGWTVLEVAGFPLGWVKQSNGLIKNHYPKGLRWL